MRSIARAASLWIVLGFASAVLADTPPGAPSDLPADYAAAVRMLGEELAGIGRDRQTRQFARAQEGGLRVSAIAQAAPALARKPGAFADSLGADSARAAIDRACREMDAEAGELRAAAVGLDTTRIDESLARAARRLAELDAWVPRQYVCPMRCEGHPYARNGMCPVCQMRLKLVTDDRYRVEITTVPARVRARSPVSLQFRLTDPAGFEVRDLEVVHEKLLHLMVVSRNLSRFDHVHPERLSDGRFTLQHRFPAGGAFVLFHDFTTTRAGLQVVPVEIQVEGGAPDSLPLLIDAAWPKRVDGYDVALSHTAPLLGAEVALTFTLTRGGKPVTDLEPFLGAPGHLVVIREGAAAYVHSHPLPENATTGPSVQFNTWFSRTGVYKAWGQFQRGGRVITVPFVIEITYDGHAGSRAVAPEPRRRRL